MLPLGGNRVNAFREADDRGGVVLEGLVVGGIVLFSKGDDLWWYGVVVECGETVVLMSLSSWREPCVGVWVLRMCCDGTVWVLRMCCDRTVWVWGGGCFLGCVVGEVKAGRRIWHCLEEGVCWGCAAWEVLHV